MKTLRNIFLSGLLIASASVFAQKSENLDIIETTKLEKAKFDVDGVMVEKKIKITEVRTQEVDTKPTQSHLLNQDRLNTPIKVTKTIMMDVNKDNKFERTAIITYKVKNNEIFDIKVTSADASNTITKDEIILGGEKQDAYVIGDNGLAVFGYIDEENNSFVVDYF